MKHIKLGNNPIVCQKWVESERGWGVRPDGLSLHLNVEGLAQFIQRYWGSIPDTVPSEYSHPDGDPYTLGVSDDLYARIANSQDGIRFVHVICLEH